MSNPTCTRSSLIAASACFRNPPLNDAQLRAAKIYFMAAQLAAIGGTNYLAVLDSTLVTDADCLSTLNLAEQRAIDLVIEKNNAVAAGATIGTIDSILSAIACLQNVPNYQFDAMEHLLRCALGQAKAYPQ